MGLKYVAMILFTLSTTSFADNNLIVQLPEGKIQGVKFTTTNNESGSIYYGFLDVPFAAPPVEENRFKEPQDPSPWDGILNTTQNQKYCYQSTWSRLADDLKQSEDCLYLNVYTPMNPGDEGDLPVYVWIHGGAFANGYASFYGPQVWMDLGIIVVTIQYRLGPFGFLTTQDGVIPGNLGLKDQRKALRWVKSNIGLFGGDPDKISIGGESAGASSVGYMMLDPHINGLFRGAIQQSGSPIMRLYVTHAQEYAFQLGSLLDESFSSINSSIDLLGLLRSASPEEILSSGDLITEKAQKSEPDSAGFVKIVVWGPVIENEEFENEPIDTLPMHLAFLNGNFNQVPTLIGINSEESLLFLEYDGADVEGIFNLGSYDDESSLLVDTNFIVDEKNVNILGSKIKEMYTNTTFSEDLAAYVRLTTDAGFTNGILAQANSSSTFVPVYLYEFSYVGERGTFLYPSGTRPNIPGAENVGHAEDLIYLWDIAPLTTDDDIIMRNKLIKLWSNFIKYQNPTPEEDDLFNNIIWPTVTNRNLDYLNINDTFELRDNPRYFKQIQELFDQYVTPYSVY